MYKVKYLFSNICLLFQKSHLLEQNAVFFNEIHLPANSVVASVSPISQEKVLPMSPTSSDKASVHTKAKKDETNGDFLDFDFNAADLTKPQKDLLIHFLHKNRKVFAKDLGELEHTQLYNHVIETGDAFPVRKHFIGKHQWFWR